MTDSFSQRLTDEEIQAIDDQTDQITEGDFTEGTLDEPERGDFGAGRSGAAQYSNAKKLFRDYDLDIKNHYRTEAGQNSPFGNVSYRLLTNAGSGFSFHEDGINRENLQTVVSGRSVEALGKQIERNRDAAQDEMVPAKLIKCFNGDYVVDCDKGDIIFRADNIKFLAKGTSDTNDGDIHLQANKNIFMDAPEVRIVGSNLRLTARRAFTISGKVSGGIVAGLLSMASSDDFAAVQITKKMTDLIKALKVD
tara:strand:+ start:1166 stop:1918 length:753 start_codon:yes stop_codon:yes gene_type:complete